MILGNKTIREQLISEWDKAHEEKEAVQALPEWTLESMLSEEPLPLYRPEASEATDRRSPEQIMLDREENDPLTDTQWSPFRSEQGLSAEKARIHFRRK